jgi:hypothetical protein
LVCLLAVSANQYPFRRDQTEAKAFFISGQTHKSAAANKEVKFLKSYSFVRYQCLICSKAIVPDAPPAWKAFQLLYHTLSYSGKRITCRQKNEPLFLLKYSSVKTPSSFLQYNNMDERSFLSAITLLLPPLFIQ